MKHNGEKGMVLGITTITMLVLLLMVGIAFAIIVAKTKYYYNQNQEVLERINIQIIAQEVYVRLRNDIELDTVQESYLIKDYGSVDITIYEDNYYYEVVTSDGRIIQVRVSPTGYVDEWVIN